MKTCTKCGIEKPFSAFGSHARQRTGKQSQCKQCINLPPEQSQLMRARARLARPMPDGSLAKICSHCDALKPVEEFYKASPASRPADGYMAACKQCSAKRAAERRADRYSDPHKARELRRREEQRRLRLRYGVSLETVELMKLARSNRCDICGNVMEGRRERALHVDHCHNGGGVRGLLCGDCNRGLGCFHDDPARMRSAIAYLERAQEKDAA